LLIGTEENKMDEAAIVELSDMNTLTLPPTLAANFRPADRFLIWSDGDTLHLKRITPAPVTDIVNDAADEDAMSMEEINAIVHEVRRQRA
jgi:hypothetical protein